MGCFNGSLYIFPFTRSMGTKWTLEVLLIEFRNKTLSIFFRYCFVRQILYFFFISLFPVKNGIRKNFLYGKWGRTKSFLLFICFHFYYLFSNFRNWICAGLFFILYHGSNVKNRWGLLILLEIRGGCRGTPWILCQLFNQSLIRVMLTRRLLDFLLLYYPHTLLFSFIDFILSFNKQ